MGEAIQLHSIFESISGEAGVFPQGTWCTFVRLQGCKLRCSYCDTKHAQKFGAEDETVSEVADQCARKHVLITGGEPLDQPEALLALITTLLQRGHLVQVETNGYHLLPRLSNSIFPVCWVVDYKLPSSGMHRRMPTITAFGQRLAAARLAGDKVVTKWVVSDERDLTVALAGISRLVNTGMTMPHFISPVDGKGEHIRWIVQHIRKQRQESLLDHIAFSVQLHKILNMD